MTKNLPETPPNGNNIATQKNCLNPPPPPHLTQTLILWSNEEFYKVTYEDQICLSWPN